MLSEVAVAGALLPPLFVYALFTMPLFLLLRWLLVRSGVLARIWHPGLFEFSLSLSLLALMVLYV